MQNDGFSKDSIQNVSRWLKVLNRHTDLSNPESVKAYVANIEKSNAYKNNLLWAYDKYCQFLKIEWSRPSYKHQSKMIRVPTTEQLDSLIASSTRAFNSIMLRLSKETGLRPIEVCNLKVRDLDTATRIVYPTTAKGGTARKMKISEQLTAGIRTLIVKQKSAPTDKIFNIPPQLYGKRYRHQRNNLAERLNQPELRSIRLYDFRHYYATRLYAKTRDILLVQHQLGHRSLKSTLIYTHLITYNEEEEYTCKTATNVKEATNLVEHGFQYVTEIDGHKLFRKRK